MARTVWILSRELIGDILLGPTLRIRDVALRFAEAGWNVNVLSAPGSRPLNLQGVMFGPLLPGFTTRIGEQDKIVIAELLPARAMFELLRSRHPFHWDVYGLSLPETLSFAGAWPKSRTRADSRRKDLRYVILARAADRIWISHPHQGTFLAALLAKEGNLTDARAAFELPSKLLEVPMGCRSDPFRTGKTNPYPEQGVHGPVYLWGGGVWKWFDTETVIRAFRILSERSTPGSLFFLSGRNESTSDYDAPLDAAMRSARENGVLGNRVFFNAKRVGPDDLSGWLEHSVGGVMGNRPTLESWMSWRTRYLDLLWAGRPLVASGKDPLAEKMERAGAAILVPPEDPEALANALSRLICDPDLHRSMCDHAKQLGMGLSARAVLDTALRSFDRDWVRGPSPGVWELARYLLGR